jgi:hypothetical protein
MIIGRFYFKRTTSGNLIGEFSNNTMNRNCTEGADRIYPDTGTFVGTYMTTWSEINTPQVSQMVIMPKSGCINIFTVEWTDLANKNIIFSGEGMMVHDILIGDYRDQLSIP